MLIIRINIFWHWYYYYFQYSLDARVLSQNQILTPFLRSLLSIWRDWKTMVSNGRRHVTQRYYHYRRKEHNSCSGKSKESLLVTTLSSWAVGRSSEYDPLEPLTCVKNCPKSVCPRFDIQKRPSFCKSVILIKRKSSKPWKLRCILFPI